MSKKKRNKKAEFSSLNLSESKATQAIVNEKIESSKSIETGKNRWWVIALALLLSLGVLGAGLKYLEEDAQRQMQNGKLKAGNKE